MPLYQVLGAQGISHQTEALGGAIFGSSSAAKGSEMAMKQSHPKVGNRRRDLKAVVKLMM